MRLLAKCTKYPMNGNYQQHLYFTLISHTSPKLDQSILTSISWVSDNFTFRWYVSMLHAWEELWSFVCIWAVTKPLEFNIYSLQPPRTSTKVALNNELHEGSWSTAKWTVAVLSLYFLFSHEGNFHDCSTTVVLEIAIQDLYSSCYTCSPKWARTSFRRQLPSSQYRTTFTIRGQNKQRPLRKELLNQRTNLHQWLLFTMRIHNQLEMHYDKRMFQKEKYEKYQFFYILNWIRLHALSHSI